MYHFNLTLDSDFPNIGLGTKLKSLQGQFVGTLHALRLIFIRRLRKIAKNDYYLRHIRLFVRMEQLGLQRTEFREI